MGFWAGVFFGGGLRSFEHTIQQRQAAHSGNGHARTDLLLVVVEHPHVVLLRVLLVVSQLQQDV